MSVVGTGVAGDRLHQLVVGVNREDTGTEPHNGMHTHFITLLSLGEGLTDKNESDDSGNTNPQGHPGGGGR